MNLFFLILLIVLLLTVLLFTATLSIIFKFDSEKANMNITLFWLRPFLKALVTIENSQPILTVYILNKRVYSRAVKAGKRKSSGMDIVKLANPKDVQVNAYYGFQDPFNTGVACGVISIASQFINIDSIQNVPDFMAGDDYIYFDATAKVNVGSALMSLYKTHNTSSEK